MVEIDFVDMEPGGIAATLKKFKLEHENVRITHYKVFTKNCIKVLYVKSYLN